MLCAPHLHAINNNMKLYEVRLPLKEIWPEHEHQDNSIADMTLSQGCDLDLRVGSLQLGVTHLNAISNNHVKFGLPLYAIWSGHETQGRSVTDIL